MNGVHDLGGAQGFGPVAPEPEEPVFHADWERRALALSLAMNSAGMWNIDMVRHARERIPASEYLAASYYKKWLLGLQRLLMEHGLVASGELAGGHSVGLGVPLKHKLNAEAVAAVLAKGSSYERTAQRLARFKVGDQVRARIMNPLGHTRLPRYVRGRTGTISRIHGVHVFPDANAAGRGEDPQWLYSVAFEASEVWGGETRAGDDIRIDLWEPYLETA
jgi:nitrile hydratase subunit beta